MQPVFQTKFGWGEGDCCWAVLASIFEEPLESFYYDRLDAPSDPDLAKLTACRWPHLECCYADLGYDYRLIPGLATEENPNPPERWTYSIPAPEEWSAPTDGYWMASVFSQKLMHPVDSPYHGMRGLHAIVMHGEEVAHDPNPRNAPYVRENLPLVMATWWEPRG